MRVIPLTQGTPAWLAWRRQGLGASDAGVLLGVAAPGKPGPYKSPLQLWRELTGQAVPEEADYAMRRGQRLEKVARLLYEERTGRGMPPACVEHAELPWLRASLDGLDLFGETLLEIKCVRLEVHRLALSGQVHPYHLAQVQHQLLASGAQVAHYWSYSENVRLGPKDQTALVEVAPDPDYQARLLAAARAFWECVTHRVPPAEVSAA